MPTKPQHLEKIKVFLDSADPDETNRILNQIGFLDGQTTNPTLLTKNPIVLNTPTKFKEEDLWDLYGTILEEISYNLPKGSISGEVYSNPTTTTEQMLAQGREINSWIDNAVIKLPTTNAGLEAANILISEGLKVNMTLGFTQLQAAAVHNATLGAKRGQVYFSLFIGRLMDHGIDGMTQLEHVKKMYAESNSHVEILACSLRTVDQVQSAVQRGADIITIPYRIIRQWMEEDFVVPAKIIPTIGDLIKPQYQAIDLKQDYKKSDLNNPLLINGLERFATDWRGLLLQ